MGRSALTLNFQTQDSIFKTQLSMINLQVRKQSFIPLPSPAGSAPYCALAKVSICSNERLAQYSTCSVLPYQPIEKVASRNL
jgi:hypothetical protein